MEMEMDSGTATEEHSEFASSDLRDSVFSNAVVWRTLGKCLNFSDLKDCRRVSQDFNRNIMDKTNFKSRAVLKLNKTDLSRDAFGATQEKWKIVSLPISTAESEDQNLLDLNWLYPLLNEVESLTLRNELNFESGPVPSYMEGVLKASKNLKSLCLDPMLLNSLETDVLEPCRDVLSKLKELEVSGFQGRPLSTFHLERQKKSIEGLASVVTNVTALKVSAVVPEHLDTIFEEVDEDVLSKMGHFMELMDKNKGHLQSLELEDMPFWSKTDASDVMFITNQVFPALKKVKIRASQIDGKNVQHFLRIQPDLEEIDITVLNQFPNDLLKTIREKGESLKKLKIKTKGFERLEDNMWKFLNDLDLETFSLNLIQSNKYSLNSDYPAAVVANLPSSIRQIHLRGLPLTDGESGLTSADFANINPIILTKLDLSQCGNIVTDATVEFICRNLHMLQDLNLSNADYRCTDYGFIGIRPEQEPGMSSFSISNLKGLKSLTLRACGVITDRTLRLGIRFLELRYLDVSSNNQLTAEGYLEVLKNNPSVEELRTSEVDDFPLEDELRKTVCPRLKYHQFSDGGDSDDEDASENHHYLGSGSGGSDFGYDMDDDFYDEYADYDDDYDNSDDGWCFG